MNKYKDGYGRKSLQQKSPADAGPSFATIDHPSQWPTIPLSLAAECSRTAAYLPNFLWFKRGRRTVSNTLLERTGLL